MSLQSSAEQKVREFVADNYDPQLLFMDGFDDCVLGVVERFGDESCVCYDKEAVLQKLVSFGMSYEDAVEYFYFNQIGGWHGERTPCFVETLPEHIKVPLK